MLGLLAGLGGATISLAVAPGWFSELTTGGQGWIAVNSGVTNLTASGIHVSPDYPADQTVFAYGSGGVYRFKDGREVPDHTYATLEYPGGRTAVFTSIESNAFDHYYEAYYGTKGTLILRGATAAVIGSHCATSRSHGGSWVSGKYTPDRKTSGITTTVK